jgi:hypothetical protein
MKGVESAVVSACWWNYAADNDWVHGDQWNGENFSVFSRETRDLPGGSPAGGRALEALLRPYPRAVAGRPMSFQFDRSSGLFSFSFRHDPGLPGPTELFIPKLQYPAGCVVTVSDGDWRLDGDAQVLLYEHTSSRDVHTIRIGRKPGTPAGAASRHVFALDAT